jgi:hypothetical protein
MRLRWQDEKYTNIQSENLNGRGHIGETGVFERLILEYTLIK